MAHSEVYERRRQAAIEALVENVCAFRATLRTVPPEVRVMAIRFFEEEATGLLGADSPLLKAMVGVLSRGVRTGGRR